MLYWGADKKVFMDMKKLQFHRFVEEKSAYFDDKNWATQELNRLGENPLNLMGHRASDAIPFLIEGEMWGGSEEKMMKQMCHHLASSPSVQLTEKDLNKYIKNFVGAHKLVSASDDRDRYQQAKEEWYAAYDRHETECNFFTSVILHLDRKPAQEAGHPVCSHPFWVDVSRLPADDFAAVPLRADRDPVDRNGGSNGSGPGPNLKNLRHMDLDTQISAAERRMLEFGSVQFELPRLPYPNLVLEFEPPPSTKFMGLWDRSKVVLWMFESGTSVFDQKTETQKRHLKVVWLADYKVYFPLGVSTAEQSESSEGEVWAADQLRHTGVCSGMPIWLYNWDLWIDQDGRVDLKEIKPCRVNNPLLSAPCCLLYHVMMSQLTITALKIISVINCENVEIENHSPSIKRRKSRRKKRKSAKLDYKTLKINRLGGAAASGSSKNAGTSNRLHLCRGHYRRYSPERPLFGKYSGLYWIQAHVRGDETQGRVVKDYEVEENGSKK